MVDLPAERERDLERFLTFVDAIVAIAITLLVLPLVDVAGELNGGTVSHLLHENQNRIGAFLLSFVVIASLWLGQHRILTTVIATDAWLIRLMLLWTLTIVALPFPTALVAQGDAGEETTTKLLYIGTMALSSVLLALICLAVDRNRDLRDTEARPDAVHAWSTASAFLVILVVMLAVPATSYWPLLLLLVPDRAVTLWRRRSGIADRSGVKQ